MIHLYPLPEEAFFPQSKPFSLILIDGVDFEPGPVLGFPGSGFLWETYHNMRASYADNDVNGYVHISNISCITGTGRHEMTNPKFLKNDILTVNLKTGKWMLRKPYSAIYP